ncbi:hemin-degrading factor [Tellurirhabdus rosea]|uniref:hemin-degrading factor n=1 Tax=Tellurirhabdus rosea TaxID=2674997 RepID=UPI002257EB66|nr:ChuX/HutX family heme-like substrate-binding protein [Tellurirhabdus rosea]
MITAIPDLKKQYAAFRAENPTVRIREAASRLGVSEAELVATGLGETATRLQGDFCQLLQEVPSLGYVMALTRNNSVVHERKGVYQDVSFNGPMGLVLGEDIDLRLFMTHWKLGFAVNENNRHSLQFFTADGEAIHKIYLTEQSDRMAYDRLVANFRAEDPSAPLEIAPRPEPTAETPDSAIAVAEFQEGWRTLQDTHDFFGLTRTYKVSRLQAMRLAPEGYAIPTTLTRVKQVLHRATDLALPVMIFVGNRGCIQIHTGPVHKLVPTGPWFNVLDPEFNLHLREDHVASAWVVKKPTTEGIVTSLELFDAEGGQIALIFGKRKPGIPENQLWRNVVAELAES